MTIPGLFDRSIARFPREVAFRQWSSRADRTVSSSEMRDRVACFSAGLIALGLEPGDRVVLIAENRPEWAIVDYATMFAGGILVPVYPNLTTAQLRAILEDSDASFAIASTRALLARLWQASTVSRHRNRTIVIEDVETHHDVHRFRSVAALGEELLRASPGVWRERAGRLAETDLATIIYTSGTTGRPKGVMLSHGNIVSNVDALCGTLDFNGDDVALSFLPLCHVIQRIADYCFFNRGVSIVHVPLDDLPRALLAVHPTVFPGVPRVFEKAREAILARVAERSAPLRALFRWCLAAGREHSRCVREGRRPGISLRLRHALSDALALSRIRQGLGGRIRFLVSGGAALSPRVMEFFLAAGLPILEGYGLTETCVLTINRLGEACPGSVGFPLPGVSLRLADDGEILAAGDNIAAGYYGDNEQTAASFAGGWFHTGDLGLFDEKGRLRITGRKKDLLITSGGKNVSPAPIEQTLLQHDLISQVVLVGNGRKCICALVVPNRRRLLAHCRDRGITTRSRGSYERMLREPAIRSIYKAIFDDLNSRLARFEQVKRFALLPGDFTVERGELTPTLKVRRAAVEEKYDDIIASLYEAPKEA